MATRIKLRRDTAANWLEQNPILAQGETGFETDTRAMKLGDGATRWADLKYAVTGDLKVTDDTIHGDTSVSLSSGLGNRENWILSISGNNGTFDDPTDTYNDGVAYDSLGNAYSVGWYSGTSGCYLQKISPSGEVLFSNFYDQYDSYGYGLTVDKNDDVIIILGENDGADGSDDIVLVKVAGTDGSIVWQKNINSYGDADDYATCVDSDLNGDIFIVGGTSQSGNDCYIGKFSGATGAAIWQKKYDIDGLDDSGTGVTVDKDGNLAVVGTAGWYGEFISVFKFNGVDGSIIWESRAGHALWENGNTYTGAIRSTDISADTNGDFYFGMIDDSDYSASMVVKFNGSTGAKMWARRIGYGDQWTGTGSLICDDQDNVYVSSTQRKYKENYDIGSSYRATQQITKINATGSVIWQRWLSAEQAETKEDSVYGPYGGQRIRVQGNYVLVGGNYESQGDYSYNNSYWYTRPYIAQLNRDGAEFEISGWSFKASDLPVEFVTVGEENYGSTFDSANVTDFEGDVTNGDVNQESNSDTTTLVYINKSTVNKVTLTEKTLTLPKGGALDVSREKSGYITAIGSFDGSEGGNNNGSVWLNGSDRDAAGATYAAGGWYSNDTWNDWESGTDIPMVYKTDADGKLIWQVGNALNQNYSNPDLVDVTYYPETNTVLALGNDGELDGNEGFNILYLDADTGGMIQPITHIRPGDNDNDIYPQSLRVMSDGTPVVSGYISDASAQYGNVTAGGAGLTGSATGFLVVNKTVFEVDGRTTEYPNDSGNWYIYPAGATVNEVNSYGYDETALSISYTGTLGSGATLNIAVTSGTPSVGVVDGGTGYKLGQRIKVLGTALGGATPDNDLELFIDSIDGGAITGFTGTNWPNAGAGADGSYQTVATTALAPINVAGWVQYAPNETEYAFNISDAGYYSGVGDTFKILGTALGGATPANDLTITVTAINDRGLNLGGITEFTLAGTAQTTTIRLYAGSDDYTQAGTYNISHELSDDAFVWTPNWNFSIGSLTSENGTYDEANGLALDSSDNVIVGGHADSLNLGGGTTWTGNPQTAYVAKFSNLGEQLWAVSIDGSEGYGTVWGVVTDADDNVYSVAETNNSDMMITKLNSDGELVWQTMFNIDSCGSYAIDVTPEGDIMVAGDVYHNNFMDNNYHKYNWNLVVMKLDRDGNPLFTRMLWSHNGLRWNNNDNYSGQLTVKGDRFSIVGYSGDPGDGNYQGIVIDLPTDGTGLGAYGNFYYEEVELNRRNRFITNDNFDGGTIVTPVTLAVRTHDFVDEPYTDANSNVSVYGDRDYQVQTIYKPEGGEVKGVAKITFEDGSVQTSSMQGLPQIPRSLLSNGDYWLRPEDNGKHIVQDWGNAVVIPDNNRVALPVGFAFTIINTGSNSGVWSENNDSYIYLSGDGGSGDNSYTIPSWSMATLVKYTNDNWMIAGSGIYSGW